LLVFESDEVLARAKKYGDLFEPVLKLKQKMPPVEALQRVQAGGAAKSVLATKRVAVLKPPKEAATPRAKSKVSGAKKSSPTGKHSVILFPAR
jgi:hypothetical protein